GVDILFCPSSEEMYPPGYRTYVSVEGITDSLCGAKRPGHFRGVATIVTKLFSIISPHKAFFGQKDYQQTIVIKRLNVDLNLGIEVVVLPTIREADGLAMSSRNSYLSADERKKAVLIYKSLCSAEKIFASGERRTSAIVTGMEQILHNIDGIEVEYLSVVDGTTLEDISLAQKGDVIAVAAKVGRTRLIDNTIL
ncbi:MAG: pantoate--beta-alanine ligase, partial [Nitrospirota bacterium]|nr:pantoate--beta-alanine ligase [Nitrospirota bacterium]